MNVESDRGVAEADAALAQVDHAECLRLLAGHEIGRVFCTEAALPAVAVVTYALRGRSIVFRTTADSRLARLVPGSIVAFEVDELDRATRTGWSVVVTGPATRVTEPSHLARLDALRLAPWAPGDRRTYVEISPGMMTGRRVTPGASATDVAVPRATSSTA